MLHWFTTALSLLAAIGFVASGLTLYVMILPFLCDYDLRKGRLRIIVFRCFPIAHFRTSQFREAFIMERALYPTHFFNPFRTLRLGNRIGKDRVVIVRAGILKNLILTPRNPKEFLTELRLDG